jgi:signal transduction protein with GAF and PtsI domain
VWKDVTIEERSFKENPHATRRFKSMVSIPILIGDHAIGVFNVVTERVDAFDVADVNYLTSLGAVIQTAVGVAVKDAKVQENRERRPAIPAKAAVGGPAKPGTLRRIAPKAAPDRGVGSQESPEGMEASDD